MKTPDKELRRLVDAWHDGTISPEDGLRLEQRLGTDPDAARYWLEISAIEAALPGAAAGISEGFTAPPVGKFSLTPWLKIAAVFVLGLLCGGLLWPPHRAMPVATGIAPPTPAVHGALITGMLGISWDNGRLPPRIGIPAGAEEVTFASGLMELTFASGTRTVIEGPAGFQVLGPNTMNLIHGKIVANVPKGAEGFSVTCRDGKVVDLGTEFAMNTPRDGNSSMLGVFRGEIQFLPRDGDGEVLHLRENQALRTNLSGGSTIPFERSGFHRELPSREFAWEMKGDGSGPGALDFDVSHLVWKPGHYRVVCKWMAGGSGVVIKGAELLYNDISVTGDDNPGFAGDIHLKPDNVRDLLVPDDRGLPGRWTLRLRLASQFANPAHKEDARGLLLFEEGLSTLAAPEDFAGVWEYLYNGRPYHRTYHLDGSAELVTKEGSAKTFHAARWRVENGIMLLDVPEENGTWVTETHLLRDSNTLIFANQPYQNARRIGPVPGSK